MYENLTRWLVAYGTASHDTIERYCYGGVTPLMYTTDPEPPKVPSGRASTPWTYVFMRADNPWVAQDQIDRFASGLIGARMFDTPEAAGEYLADVTEHRLRKPTTT